MDLVDSIQYNRQGIKAMEQAQTQPDGAEIQPQVEQAGTGISGAEIVVPEDEPQPQNGSSFKLEMPATIDENLTRKIDANGHLFDPLIHVSPESVNKDGSFRRKKGSSKVSPVVQPSNESDIIGVENGAGNSEEKEIKNLQLDPKTQKLLAKQIAEASANSFAMVGCMVCGSDFAPDAEEKKLIVDAFTAYYLSKGTVEIPPGVLLAITLASFTAQKCIHKPTIRERLFILYTKATETIKGWWS